MPCVTTAASATRPSAFTQRRESFRQSQATSTMVSRPTELAMSRCPCSYRMPPTHRDIGKLNIDDPYVVGQSGTDRPDPVLVTSPPAVTRTSVATATSFAKR